MFVPFATSIVLVMGSPDAEPAQPRALVGGHLVSTVVGLVMSAAGPSPWAAAVAVGLAMAAMQVTRTFHPPAGIDPLSWWSQRHGLALSARAGGGRRLLLAAFALLWHNLMRRGAWPADGGRRSELAGASR